MRNSRTRARSDVPVVILGAGPCGLACAHELQRLGHRDWVLLEAAPTVGGLGSSVVDEAGFTWDLGGHVVFSKMKSFDKLLAELFEPAELLRHERSSFVRHSGNWVPYPFQQHLHHLPRARAQRCLDDLTAAQARGPAPGGTDFASWLEATYGPALVEEFFAPYNRKIWATGLSEMSASWIAERVAPADIGVLRRALKTGFTGTQAWGPNAQFAFPASGGTGAIWRRLAARLDGDVRTGQRVVHVDEAAKTLLTADGTVLTYGHLVATGALDGLVAMTAGAPADVRHAASILRHTTVVMAGLGYRSPTADRRSWLYFPGGETPFYRATNFSRYAPANVPGSDTGRYSAWMTETSLPAGALLDQAGLVEKCDRALRHCGLVPERAERVSGHVELIPYAYPVPTTGRDEALALIQPWLERHSIYSRGRFGTWRYEIGNMDHAVTMGQDIARRLTRGTAERIYTPPRPTTVGAGDAR
ncbi:protoporphyrinogen/coproporphyrinogen oxidase [Streptomyces europaeiscabiei]|uniref:protoporphyrinogen/coproporphyrinogen oxidase n=1 Tax=Streptomyces europaeiscabiei TaxID=146819 RepID=UPI0029AC3532|nr:FAD-dependent oxidoreductase [Streptomyces europaeiscabiei]MDX2757328.1 FAD-dependent oxidoreductase [Streptomyces europaeiscabiei]